MLVTFRSNAWANITMFGDVAVELFRLRAYPLVQLLTASAKECCDVMWAEGRPVV